MVPLRLSGGKFVGEIVGGTAYLPVTSKNYLVVGQGYSVDDHVLNTIMNAGATSIDFYHKKTDRHFRVTVENFRANAKPFEYGFGRKWAAPMTVYEV